MPSKDKLSHPCSQTLGPSSVCCPGAPGDPVLCLGGADPSWVSLGILASDGPTRRGSPIFPISERVLAPRNVLRERTPSALLRQKLTAEAAGDFQTSSSQIESQMLENTACSLLDFIPEMCGGF